MGGNLFCFPHQPAASQPSSCSVMLCHSSKMPHQNWLQLVASKHFLCSIILSQFWVAPSQGWLPFNAVEAVFVMLYIAVFISKLVAFLYHSNTVLYVVIP